MILDAQLMFSDAQALTATAVSTNILDMGVAARIFKGPAMGVLLIVDAAADFTSANETYQFDLQTDDNSAFSSATVIGTTTITAANLTLGSRHVLPVAIGAKAERYLRLNYTLGGTTPSITVSTFLQPIDMIDTYETYKDNSAIQ